MTSLKRVGSGSEARFSRTILVLARLALGTFVIVASLVACDQLLRLFDFPFDRPIQTSHPENYRAVVRNLEFEYEFVTNDQGLRYRHIPLEKETGGGETRILVLGDSFVEGTGAKDDQRFTSRLEGHFTRRSGRTFRFINGGVGGRGPEAYWRLFSRVAVNYGPDGVLLCIYANDLGDMSESLSREDLYRIFPVRQGPKRWVHALYPRLYTLARAALWEYAASRDSFDFAAGVTREARRRGISRERIEKWRSTIPVEWMDLAGRNELSGWPLSYGLLQPDYWVSSLDIHTPAAENRYASMIVAIDEILNEARKREMAVGVVFLPTAFQYDPSRHETSNPWVKAGAVVRTAWLRGESELQRRLAQWAREREVAFFDLTPVLRREVRGGSRLNWKLDDHWTPDGHRVVAEALAAWIEKEEIFDSIGS